MKIPHLANKKCTNQFRIYPQIRGIYEVVSYINTLPTMQKSQTTQQDNE